MKNIKQYHKKEAEHQNTEQKYKRNGKHFLGHKEENEASLYYKY